MTVSLLQRFVVLACLVTVSHCSAVAQETPAAENNLARGKPYTLTPFPRYEHCQDTGDAVQLTDGELSAGYFWTNKGTVGWVSSGYGAITVDLQRIEPIAGAAFRTAAGTAGVEWPLTIRVLVSDDGQVFHDVGDLVTLDQAENGPLPAEGYQVRRLVTHRLKTRGRYVRFMVVLSGPFGFVDEVEIFRGPDSWTALDPTGPVVASDPEEHFGTLQISSGIQHRFATDRQQVSEALERLPADKAPLVAQLRTELENIGNQWATDQFNLGTFDTRIPLNETHARLFGVQARIWRAAGCDCFIAWRTNPWDPLDLHGMPVKQDRIEPIVVHAMRGEYRSAAVNIANSGDLPIAIKCHVEGIPGSPTPSCLTLYQAAWTDTRSGQPVASALEEIRPADGAWQTRLLPGIPGQLWLTFHTTDLEARRHDATLVLETQQQPVIRIPLALHVYPLDFPSKTSLLVGGWSYTNGRGSYGMTPENRQALVDHLQQHFVNAPWATGSVLNQVQFRDDGEIQLDTQELDLWLKEWPAARRYHVFVHVPTSFGGDELGTDRFRGNVARWINAWVAHLADRGVQANQLGLLLRDEPNESSDVSPIIAWSQAIRTAQPDVVIWEDPTYADPRKAPPELWDACDVICPNRVMWLSGPPSFHELYLDHQKDGKTLQFYSCSGPARLLDPYSYYRLQAWQCWQVGATGSFFWAFGDNGGASSWNEYAVKGSAFTPLFLDARSVTAAKQMEAVRESVEDYEYLVMLREGIRRAEERGLSADRLQVARQLLTSAAQGVLNAPGCNDIFWHTTKDRSGADAARVEILKQLTELREN